MANPTLPASHSRPVPRAGSPPSESRRLASLIDLALMQVAAQLQQADADDSKALALLTLDAALAGILIGVRIANVSITPFWFVPLIGFALAALLLVLSLLPRDFSAGPPPRWLFEHTQRMTPAEADETLLAGLQDALSKNGRLLEDEAGWYFWALIVTAVSVVGGGGLLYVLSAVVR